MSEIKVDNLTGKTSAGDITVTSEGGAATMQLQQGLAKAWVNFDGTGTSAGDTITARDSFNITSIVDSNTGDYDITIANDMANANYVHAGNSGGGNGTSSGAVYAYDQSTARTTTLFKVLLISPSGSSVDTPQINIIVSGDLA